MGTFKLDLSNRLTWAASVVALVLLSSGLSLRAQLWGTIHFHIDSTWVSLLKSEIKTNFQNVP